MNINDFIPLNEAAAKLGTKEIVILHKVDDENIIAVNGRRYVKRQAIDRIEQDRRIRKW